MFRKIDDFVSAYTHMRETMLKVYDALTDESLSTEVAPGFATLGKLAWHIATTPAEMMARTGLAMEELDEKNIPGSVAPIKKLYAESTAKLLDLLKQEWKDETLEIEDDMYGMSWKRGMTLGILTEHEAHHRGQMTVLMRQAGLRVPGVCGPSKEEWAEYGMEEPG